MRFQRSNPPTLRQSLASRLSVRRWKTLATVLCAATAGFSTGALAAGPPTAPGAALFAEKCAMCHRVMGMGTVLLMRRRDAATAPLENRKDLTAEFVAVAARAGIGNMPRISRGEVSDAELNAIAEWLSVPAETGTAPAAAPPGAASAAPSSTTPVAPPAPPNTRTGN